MRITFLESDKRCYVTGERIPLFDPYCMSHVLGKGAHPDWRTKEGNMVLMTRPVHDDWHSGMTWQQLMHKDRRWYKFLKLYAFLKIVYSRENYNHD